MNKLPLLRFFFVLCLCAAAPAFARGSSSISKFAELGDNTYAYTRQAKTGFNRDIDKLTAEAKDDAAKYCASQGKQLKVVAIDVDKPWMTLGYASVKVTFRALASDDPALAAPEQVVVTNVRKKQSSTIQQPVVHYSPTNDLYNDLLKLDELRKKGILTDEEFQSEKQKVLNRSK